MSSKRQYPTARPVPISRGGTPAQGTSAGVLPASATRAWIVAAGFITFVLALFWVRAREMSDAVNAGLICIGATAAVNFGLDFFVLKVHRRGSTGLNWGVCNHSWERTLTKFLGLLGSFGFVGLIYWLFQEYRTPFYDDYWTLLRRILPWWTALAVPYFYILDARQTEPRDELYQMGLMVTLRFRKLKRDMLVQHLLGWLVKGYFMPLMFTYLCADIRKFISLDFSNVQETGQIFDFVYDSIFLLDVALCSAGYLLAMRLFDTHLRWAEPTLKGWVVALFCYEPFWSLFGKHYLDYESDYSWGSWLHGTPWLYCIWGSMILALLGVYVWSTVMFGCRFSNLTNRGIITNGPYRWTKHPAYISKNLAWWLISVPFVVSESWQDSVRRCGALFVLNWIYYLRAQTEEAHLSRDPAYIRYVAWLQHNSLFAQLRRLLVIKHGR